MCKHYFNLYFHECHTFIHNNKTTLTKVVIDHLGSRKSKDIDFLIFKFDFKILRKVSFHLHCRVNFKRGIILFSYHELHFTLHFNVLCHTIHSSCIVSFSQADLFKHTSLAISSPFPGLHVP